MGAVGPCEGYLGISGTNGKDTCVRCMRPGWGASEFPPFSAYSYFL